MRPEIMSIFAASLVAGLTMASLHWFPWPRQLHRVEAYAMGLGGVLTAFTMLAVLYAWWVELIALWAIALAAGCVTVLCYAYDSWRAWRNRAKAVERGNQADEA